MVEHVLSGRKGDWRVLIVGSQESDRWEMKIFGPNAFERSYTLEGTSGEQLEKHRANEAARHAAGLFVEVRSGRSTISLEEAEKL